MNIPEKILLASNSPRRRKLLTFTGLTFEMTSANVDESLLPHEKPANYVLRLAAAKARTAAQTAEGAQIVIGSDTAVVHGEDILGKPSNADEAAAMLRQLRGRTHQVYTALAVYRITDDLLESELCISHVPMRNYSDDELQAYVQSGDPLDKAGGYAIQNDGFHPVEQFNGCYASGMGLPLCHLTRMLGRLGIPASADVPVVCQANLKYTCPVFPAILRGEQIG
ncbi:MAG: Maf family protein [Anaerolineales bacterium]|nr:Maf family protein [Anaerolineales bacterium]